MNYFKSKKFKKENIASMVSKNAKFLLMSTERIDAKLGFYQRCFKLNGKSVTLLIYNLVYEQIILMALMSGTWDVGMLKLSQHNGIIA